MNFLESIRKVLLIVVAVPAAACNLPAQTQTPIDAQYARVEHANGSATLSVFNVSRPLLEGLRAAQEEYAWKVDLEEPPHESFPRGGKFESTYPEGPDICVSSSSEARVLNKIVSDYNQAGFPAKYSVIAQSDGSYAVAGTAIQDANGTYHPVTPILDTPISIPNGTRRQWETLDLILKALTAASGAKVLPNPPNMWGNMLVTVGGDNIPARTLLQQIFPSGMVWDLYFDPLDKSYMLNVHSGRPLQWTRPRPDSSWSCRRAKGPMPGMLE